MAKLIKERTLVILKPDAVQRSLMGEIIKRIERSGLKFVAFKFLVPTEQQCWDHYHKDEKWFLEKGNRVVSDRKNQNLSVDKEPIEYGKDIIRANVNFFTSGPVLAMVVEGNSAVGIVKKLVGGTEPLTSDIGTIRGDYTVDSYELSSIDNRAVRNLVHCSDSPAEAAREIDIWFAKNELVNYRLVSEQILYDVNLDGILE
ncbi:MAG: nucleoside-diphosphate kinase [Candidatus Buchananbacteria bacterium]|nr:nucleoside-diphosphate kinase [Candidatus Buchananbacteria bacterium]